VASETKVWPIINENVAYLTKVLVLKQKFPDAYALLKERWDEPEGITGNSGESGGKELANSQLSDFMSLTSRISTNDAEPFIYFKTPVRSGKLKHSDELRKAMTTGTNEIVSDLIKKEHNNNDVAEFVCDLLKKYRAQPRALLNIFASHAAAFEALNASINLKKYYDTTISIIDLQLWQSHQELPIDYVFSLVANELTMKKTRTLILDRYIAVLETKDGVEDYLIKVFNNLIKVMTLLSSSQKTKIRQAVEDKYTSTSIVLQLFEDGNTQNGFVSTGALKIYISEMDDANIASRVEVLKKYKDYMAKNGMIEILFVKLTEVLTTANANKPSEQEIRASILASMSAMLSLYQSELKEMGAAAEPLGEALLATYPQIPLMDERGMLVNDMYWINHVTSPALRDRLNVLIGEFIGGATIEPLRKAVGYWSEETRQNLLRTRLSLLLPRLTDPAILSYVYANVDQPTQLEILKHLAVQPGINDITFISRLEQLPGKTEILDAILKKVDSISYDQRAPYYDFVTSQLNSRDTPELKDAIIAQAKGLLRTDDPQSQKVAYDLITKLKMLSETYKRDIGKDLLEWLKQPGRVVTANHAYALKVLTYIFGSLQTPPQDEVIYLMFGLLSDTYDLQTIQSALEALQVIKPRYLKYTKDYEDALVRLESLAIDDERRQIIFNGLQSLKPKSPGIKEASYWKKYETTEQ